MKPCDVTEADAARYARLVMDEVEYDLLPDADKREIEGYLSAAKGYVSGYTGLELDSCELEDVAVALLTVFAEMVDDRQMTAQYTGQNLMVKTILDMHSKNLLPGSGEGSA